MKTTALVALAIYITGFVTYTAAQVGTISKGGEYTWGLPFTMFLLLAVPAVLGYIAGESRRE